MLLLKVKLFLIIKSCGVRKHSHFCRSMAMSVVPSRFRFVNDFYSEYIGNPYKRPLCMFMDGAPCNTSEEARLAYAVCLAYTPIFKKGAHSPILLAKQ